MIVIHTNGTGIAIIIYDDGGYDHHRYIPSMDVSFVRTVLDEYLMNEDKIVINNVSTYRRLLSCLEGLDEFVIILGPIISKIEGDVLMSAFKIAEVANEKL